MSLVIIRPEDIESFKDGLLTEYQLELAEAMADYEAAKHRGGGHMSQLIRAKKRVFRVQMKLAAAENGFLPVPRMPLERLSDWTLERLEAPGPVLERLVEAIDKGLFERFAIVEPQAGPRHRDPLLIGIVGAPNNEEHFLVGWWR